MQRRRCRTMVPNNQEPKCQYWPLARPFACLLAPLTHLLAPHSLLRLCARLQSLVRLFAHSLIAMLVGKWMMKRLKFRLFRTTVLWLCSVGCLGFPRATRCGAWKTAITTSSPLIYAYPKTLGRGKVSG